MIFVISAVLVLTVLLPALLISSNEQHPAGHRCRCSRGDLSIALREVCQGVLTPKTLVFLAKNAPPEIITSFGQQQQRLARYSLRVASDALVQSLADRRYVRSSLSGGGLITRLAEVRSVFLLGVCTVGRIGLGVVRSINWGIPRSVQAWISARILMSLGALLEEAAPLTEARLIVPVEEPREARGDALMLEGESCEVSLSQQIHEALLKALPNDLSRMIYIATLRDNNSGHYYYPELTRKLSVGIVDRAMLACHSQLFDRVLQLSLEDLTESLDVYVASTHVLKARVIQSWRKLRAYRATIPIDSDPISTEVFFMKVEVAVSILEARLPVNVYAG